MEIGFTPAQAAYEHAEPEENSCNVCGGRGKVLIVWDGIFYNCDEDRQEWPGMVIPEVEVSCPYCNE